MKDVVKFEQRTEQYLVQYDKAVTALQAAKDELSLDGLQVVDITIEALRARGKIAQDDRAKQAARELEIEKYRTAALIAQAIVDRDCPTFVGLKRRDGSGGLKRPLGARGVLVRAGWEKNLASATMRIGRATEPQLKAMKKSSRTNIRVISRIARGQGGTNTRARSEAWNSFYSPISSGVKLGVVAPAMQRMPAKQLAEQFEDRDEIILARRSAKQVRDWCDEFLKALPKVKP